MLAGMRYVLLLLGVLTAFFMPRPLGAMGAQGQLIATIDRFAWLCMIVLAFRRPLVVLAMPEATMGLSSASAGSASSWDRRLDPVLAGSGAWMLFLAGLTSLCYRMEKALASQREPARSPPG